MNYPQISTNQEKKVKELFHQYSGADRKLQPHEVRSAGAEERVFGVQGFLVPLPSWLAPDLAVVLVCSCACCGICSGKHPWKADAFRFLGLL